LRYYKNCGKQILKVILLVSFILLFGCSRQNSSQSISQTSTQASSDVKEWVQHGNSEIGAIREIFIRMASKEERELKEYLRESFDSKFLELSEIRDIISRIALEEEKEVEEYLIELFESKMEETDLNIVAESLFNVSGYKIFPWDWYFLGTENQKKYRLWAIEADFSANDWEKLSKEQKRLIANYLNPSITNSKFFIGDFSFWSNRLYGYINKIADSE
jgi:hypothetical protein